MVCRHRWTLAAWSLALLTTATAATLAPALAAPAKPATEPLVLRAGLHEAYADHPLVAEVARVHFLTFETRDRLLQSATPSDRALAVVDAMGAGAAANDMDRFVTQAIQAKAVIGPSGALKKSMLGLDVLDARAALALGWTRALVHAGDPAKLARTGNKIDDAGAIALLQRAVALAPDAQAPKVALALALAAAGDKDTKKHCKLAVDLLTAARAGGKEPLRLATAEKVATLAGPHAKACKGKELEAFQGAIQLPPPVAEAPVEPVGRPTSGRPLASAPAHPFRDAFVVTAPVFRGWVQDQAVQKVLLPGGRLDEVQVAEALKLDPTGDRAIVLLNTSLLSMRVAQEDNADIAWWAIARGHGLQDAPDKQKLLKVTDLTPAEAMVYGYARAAASLFAAGPADGTARLASPQELFAYGKGKLPANALVGPVMQLAHFIDLDRAVDPCKARTRADGLRFVVQKSNLPAAAQAPLLQALDTVAADCPQAAAPGAAR
jgi:hypothetical protein